MVQRNLSVSLFLTAVIICLFTLFTGCSGQPGGPAGETGTGSYVLTVNWPDSAENTGKILPDGTETIDITITGENLDVPVTAQIVSPQTGVTVEDLPAGKKLALIKALDSGSNILSQRKEVFTIVSGSTTDSGNIELGAAIVADTDGSRYFEPSKLNLTSNSTLYIQNWTDTEAEVTGFPGGDATLSAAGEFAIDGADSTANTDAVLAISGGPAENTLESFRQLNWTFETIDSSAGDYWNVPNLRIDSLDNIHVVYQKNDNTAKYMLKEGDTWTENTTLRSSTYLDGGMDIELDSQDRPAVVIRDHQDYYPYFTIKTDTGWYPHQVFTYSDNSGWWPDITVDQNGKLAFIHLSGNNASNIMHFHDGTSDFTSSHWTTQNVSQGATYGGRYPNIVFDSQNRPHCAAYWQPSGTPRTIVFRRNAGGTWSSVYVLEENSWTISGDCMVIDSRDRPALLYQSKATNKAKLAIMQNDDITDWSIEVVGPGDGSTMKLDDYGNLCIVRTDLNAGKSYFQRKVGGKWFTHEIKTTTSMRKAILDFDSAGNPNIIYWENNGIHIAEGE